MPVPGAPVSTTARAGAPLTATGMRRPSNGTVVSGASRRIDGAGKRANPASVAPSTSGRSGRE